MHWGNFTLFAALLFIFFNVNAQQALEIYSGSQKDIPKGWHLMDAANDSIHGISLHKTYDLLKGKKSRPVIVAVIDSGVDTTHEDLKNVLWKNSAEIPGNGIDDDGNGYVDDVYGWNFLGGKDGRSLKKEVKEISRVYHRYKEKFGQSGLQTDSMSDDEKEQYNLWKKAEKELEVDAQSQVELMFLEMAVKAAKKHDKLNRQELCKQEYKSEELEKYQPKTSMAQQAKLGYLRFVKIIEMDPEETNISILSQLDEYIQEKRSI